MFNDIINQASEFLYINRNFVFIVLIIIYLISEFFFAKDYFSRNNKRIKKEIIYQRVDSFAMAEIITNFLPFFACYIVFHYNLVLFIVSSLLIWAICGFAVHIVAFFCLSEEDRKERFHDIDF